MFLSLNSSTVGGRVPWPEFAHLAQRTGYLGVDVNLGKAMGEGLDSTRALLKELKLKSSAFNLPVEFRKDEAPFRQGLDKLKPAAEFARGIGSPRMITWILPSSENSMTACDLEMAASCPWKSACSVSTATPASSMPSAEPPSSSSARCSGRRRSSDLPSFAAS